MSTFWFYFKEGLFHVLDWDAYDHILFLIVLAAPYLFASWKKLLYLVSIFTIGHTISLALASYDIVSVDTTIIEFLIPVTIMLTAIYNIFTAGKSHKNTKMAIYFTATMFFGVIHGFGFSTYFKMMTAGSDSKLMPLIKYTLGIEVAQITIVIAVIILGFIAQTIFRFSRRDWVLIVSAIVIGVAIPLLRTTLQG